MLCDACVGAPGEDPRPRRLCRLQQPSPQTPLQPRLQLKVGLSARDRDQELGLLQAPLTQQQRQNQLGIRVVRKTDVLEQKDLKN